jgi:hypothetical protein
VLRQRKMSRELEAFVNERLKVLRVENFAKLPLSWRLFIRIVRPLSYLAAGMAVLDLLHKIHLDFIAPVFADHFSKQSLLHLALGAYLLFLGVPLFRYCERTRLASLPSPLRNYIDLLLYCGALVFIASSLLLRLEVYWLGTVLALLSLAMVRYARSRAEMYA